MIDSLADALFGGNPRTSTELVRLFAFRAGFRWGVLVGILAGCALGVLPLVTT